MKRILKKKKGFTLIEIIAAVAIFSIVSVFLTSMMSTIFKFSSINKKTFDSNAVSRGFYEMLRSNRPSSTNLYPDDGVYYVMYIKNQENIVDVVDRFKMNSTNETFVKGDTTAKTFDQIKSTVPSSNYRYAIQVVAKKNTEGTHFYYEIETQTWDLNKGSSTEIKRKSLIAEG